MKKSDLNKKCIIIKNIFLSRYKKKSVLIIKEIKKNYYNEPKNTMKITKKY